MSVEARQHLHAHPVVHRHLDRARLQHLGALRRHLEHLLVGDLIELARLRNDARVGGVDAVDIGEDVAAIGFERRRQRHRRGVRAAAAQRGDRGRRGPTPWNPATTATCPSRQAADDLGGRRSPRCAPCRARRRCGSGSASRARSARRRRGPASASASRPAVTCSPEATTTSYSRASCSRLVWRVQSTSWLVTPAMAETTTATSLPASTSRLTRRATFRMRSISATEVPPNFCTMRAIAWDPSPARMMPPACGCRETGIAGERRVYILSPAATRQGGRPEGA